MDSGAIAFVAGRYNSLAQSEGWHSICFSVSTFEHPELNALLSIWRNLAKDAGIPRRKDLTPQLLRAHLASIAIYEQHAAPDRSVRYRVRVMGVRFTSVLGNLNGKYFDEAVPRQHLARWHAAPDAVIAARAPLRFISRSETANKDFITGEYLVAPLIGDSGEVNTVLSAAAFGPTVVAEAPLRSTAA
jgi:hypothetical protein